MTLKLNLLELVILPFLLTIIINYLIHKYICKYVLTNNKIDKDAILFGKKTSISRGISSLIFRVDALIITYFLGFEALAIYTLISIVPTQFRYAFKSINPLLLYKFSSINIERKKIINYFLLITMFSFFAIFIYFIFAKYIFMLLYPKYEDYYMLSVIFSLTLLVIPGMFLENHFQSKLSNKKINFVEISSSILNIILILSLLGMGIFGVVIGNVISRIYISCMYFYFLVTEKY